MSEYQTEKLEDISWRGSRLLSGLENIMGVVTIKTKVTESRENPGGGMMYEAENPSCGKAMSLSV